MTPLEFFQAEGISSMPVQPKRIIHRHGYKLYTYEEFSALTGEPVGEIAAGYGADGFSLRLSDEYVIVYNPQRHAGRVTWTLMHELAHIVLGHIDACGGRAIARSAQRDRYDWAADCFVADVLAPLSVLRDCEAYTPQAVHRLTGLSYAAARCRLRDLARAESCGDLEGRYERAVSRHFANYTFDTGKVDATVSAWVPGMRWRHQA